MTTNQTSEAGEMPSLCPHCNSPKSQAWHLICDKCWLLVPDQLTAELIAAHREGVGNPRHWTACQEVLRFLEEDHGLKAMAMMTPIKGLVHVCTVRGDDGWEAMCCLWDGERWLYWDDALEPKGWEPVTDMNCIVEAWDLPIMPGSPAYRTESHLRAQLAEAEQWRSQHGNAYQQVVDERDAARNAIDHLRAQLKETTKVTTDAMEMTNAAEKRAQKYMHERDAAQARVGILEELLREARARLPNQERSYVFDTTTNLITVDESPCLAERIDAALATSPHRLAGRGET